MLEWFKPYGVASAYVYPFNEVAATWGTGVKVRNLISFKLTPVQDTDRLGVYGRDEKGLSVVRGADIELEFGGIQSDVDAIMTGRTVSLSGSGTTEIRHSGIDDDSFPYFALTLQLKTKNDIGDAHVYCPTLMLNSLMPLEIAEKAVFNRPKVTAMLFGLSTEAGLRYRLWYEPQFATKTPLTTAFLTQLQTNVAGGYLIA